jgi:hypothetical protein
MPRGLRIYPRFSGMMDNGGHFGPSTAAPPRPAQPPALMSAGRLVLKFHIRACDPAELVGDELGYLLGRVAEIKRRR